jgi:hypothetical protein
VDKLWISGGQAMNKNWAGAQPLVRGALQRCKRCDRVANHLSTFSFIGLLAAAGESFP